MGKEVTCSCQVTFCSPKLSIISLWKVFRGEGTKSTPRRIATALALGSIFDMVLFCTGLCTYKWAGIIFREAWKSQAKTNNARGNIKRRAKTAVASVLCARRRLKLTASLKIMHFRSCFITHQQQQAQRSMSNNVITYNGHIWSDDKK